MSSRVTYRLTRRSYSLRLEYFLIVRSLLMPSPFARALPAHCRSGVSLAGHPCDARVAPLCAGAARSLSIRGIPCGSPVRRTRRTLLPPRTPVVLELSLKRADLVSQLNLRAHTPSYRVLGRHSPHNCQNHPEMHRNNVQCGT